MDSSEISIRTSDFLELGQKTESRSEAVRCHYSPSPPSPGGQKAGSAAPPISHPPAPQPILQPVRPEDLQAWGWYSSLPGHIYPGGNFVTSKSWKESWGSYGGMPVYTKAFKKKKKQKSGKHLPSKGPFLKEPFILGRTLPPMFLVSWTDSSLSNQKAAIPPPPIPAHLSPAC